MILQQYADDIQITEVKKEEFDGMMDVILLKKICEILSRTVTILRESSIALLDLFLQLLQHMGPKILHSEFLNFVRNVSEQLLDGRTEKWNGEFRLCCSLQKTQTNRYSISFLLSYKNLDIYSMEVGFRSIDSVKD